MIKLTNPYYLWYTRIYHLSISTISTNCLLQCSGCFMIHIHLCLTINRAIFECSGFGGVIRSIYIYRNEYIHMPLSIHFKHLVKINHNNTRHLSKFCRTIHCQFERKRQHFPSMGNVTRVSHFENGWVVNLHLSDATRISFPEWDFVQLDGF